MKKNIGALFVLAGLIALVLGLLMGVTGAFQFVFREASFNTYFPFYKTRPMHVSLILSWIVLAAAGGVYFYLPEISKNELFSKSLANAHLLIFVLCGAGIVVCYLLGIFGGREYLEFPYYFIFFILLGWIFFALNFFKTGKPDFKTMPVYMWMWATGSIFMIWTLSEAYLWLLPFFRDNVIRDITVQWKSYGAFIGAWNMLIYGTASYIMTRVSNDDSVARSRLSFALYFIGLTNMLFNWGHHTYIVPAASWIKYVSYIISMVELIILAKIIWDWKQTLSTAQKYFYHVPYRFLLASEFWIFVNLVLALLISIPAFNIYTHGTHITVAHAMGATIGINTMILFASVFFIVSEKSNSIITQNEKMISAGYWLTQFFLLAFWVMLIVAGAVKSYLYSSFPEMSFREITTSVRSYLFIFAVTGVLLATGILMVVFPLLKKWQQWTVA